MELPEDVVRLMDAALARSKALIETHFGESEFLTADGAVTAAAHLAVALFAAVAMGPPREAPDRH